MAVAGIDAGTSGCKCAVYSSEGKLLSYAYQAYEAERTEQGDCLNPLLLKKSILNVISKAFSESCEEVFAICISSFGESFVPVDISGSELSPIYLYTDNKGDFYINSLKEKLTADFICNISGAYPHTMYSLSKMMWYKHDKKEIYDKTYKFLCIHDYIINILTGEFVTDYSMAARTMAFDIRKMKWSDEILNAAEVDVNKLCTPLPTGSFVKKIKSEYASVFKYSNVKVFTGGHDQVMSCIGAGITKAGNAALGMGTVECLTPMFTGAKTDSVFCKNGYVSVPYIIKDSYVTYAFTFTSGSLTKWYKDAYYGGSNDFYANMEKNLPEKISDILVLPYFAGAATPYLDNKIKGGIVNLALYDNAQDIYKAILEGISFDIKLNTDRLLKSNLDISDITVTGGASVSKKWLQLKADILGKPLNISLQKDSGILGCAVLCLIGTGVYKDIYEASKILTGINDTVYPIEKNTAIYKEKYEKYNNMYRALKFINMEDNL